MACQVTQPLHPAAFPHNNNRGLLREAEDHVVQIPGAPALQALVQRARDLAAECRTAFPPRSSRRKVPQRATLAGAKDLVARLDACPVQFSEAAAAREVYKSGVAWEKEVTICLPLDPSPHSTHAHLHTHIARTQLKQQAKSVLGRGGGLRELAELLNRSATIPLDLSAEKRPLEQEVSRARVRCFCSCFGVVSVLLR